MRPSHARVLSIFAVAVLFLSSAPLCAETTYLFGKIGTLPIAASLERDKGTLSGWYFYASKAQDIRLEGTIDRAGAFRLEESRDGKKTGVFTGTAIRGEWTGTWQKPDGGTPLPFSLAEHREALQHLSGTYHCAAQERRAQYGYTYKWDVAIRLADGVVQTLHSTQGAYWDDKDEQICSIDLGDLKQVSSEAGILLRTRGGNPGNGRPACTVRIVGDEDTLWIQFGDSSRDGNDCRSAGDVMYCSPRAFWNDVVFDRRTQKCRAVQ